MFYPAKHAPNYPIGYKAPIAFACACILLTFLFRHLSIQYRKNKSFQVESVSSEEEYEEDREKEVIVDMKSETDALPTLNNDVKRD